MVHGLKPRDALILTLLIVGALLLMAQSGLKRASELMPWPDGLEYAAAARGLEQGRGPVLHFGGYSYPSRYTAGYPLILAAGSWLIGDDVAAFGQVTMATGLLAIVALYYLVLKLFGRAAAIAASVLLAVSPLFVTYSALVLSDVPSLAVVILASAALTHATPEPGASAIEHRTALAAWIAFGLFAGFAVTIRPTNAAILIGVGVALLVVPSTDRARRESLPALAGFGAAFALPLLWQARENQVHFGSVAASGYEWWVPEIYGQFARTFNLAYLFGPTMPRNPRGNLPVYLLSLCGLDGFLSSPSAPNFYLYPAGAAAFAMVGLVSMVRSAPSRSAIRVVFFGLGFLGALLAIYSFYVFTDVAFILPGCFVMFALAGFGASVANATLAAPRAKRRRSFREHSMVAGIIVLDTIVGVAIGRAVANRFAAPSRESEVVPALQTVQRGIEPAATIVSNVSLQFLELYIPGSNRTFVAMHTFDPGAEFTDYHVGRLYAKRAQGWRGPVPPALFDGAGVVSSTEASLESLLRAGKPVYLLFWMPPRGEYAEVLAEEVGRVRAHFAVDEISRADSVVLDRLAPR